jgi:hypothetical protein
MRKKKMAIKRKKKRERLVQATRRAEEDPF